MQKRIFRTLLIAVLFIVFAYTARAEYLSRNEITDFSPRMIEQINDEIRKIHRRIDSVVADDVRINELVSGSGVLYYILADTDGDLYKSNTNWRN